MSSQTQSTTGVQTPLVGEGTAVNTLESPKIYVESVGDCSRAIAAFVREHPDDPNSERCGPNYRESAHEDGDCHSALNGRQPIFALLGYEDIRSLEGRLLTIVDASFTDREQRKAAKDLVRNAIWFDWVPNLDMDGSGGKPDLNR